MTYNFKRDPKSRIILVDVWVDKYYKFKMALDTAASSTTFDVNAMHLLGYPYPTDSTVSKGMVETASGFMEVDIIKTNAISAFGHTVRNVDVQVYDFLAHGIISDYDGVLGIDFFEGTEFTINMKNQTIEVKPA